MPPPPLDAADPLRAPVARGPTRAEAWACSWATHAAGRASGDGTHQLVVLGELGPLALEHLTDGA
eukprot:CAMPEP_0182859150 /NCGR_PEP_ID=MMETSP0034_2-20130328/4111_1 /TAXON_ID=156128 /ORGANISM="Nephroselmis pyriformis, Strain CCMP717" /LENGTH=64 /DNA_ID=CAMNT_0024990695 /DNA_START=164 /DNA_END=355 /DNA_ORIENTATION=+